jgi:heat shock protein HslJ
MKTILRIIPFIFVLVVVSVLLGCQKDNLNNDLISTKWYLQAIQYTDSQIEDLVPENLIGMNVVFYASNKLHAISSCNTFDGDFITVGQDSISVLNLGSTLIYCTDPDRRLWESLFYNNLKNSRKYSIKNGSLSIQTTKNTVMIFK